MSKKNELKTYIVTFDDNSLPQVEVAKKLNISKEKIMDAVTAMETPYNTETIESLYYQELGCACTKMTEQEAEKLKNQKGVLEVIEDFQVHAIGDFPLPDAPPMINGNGKSLDKYADIPFTQEDDMQDWEDDLIAMKLNEMIEEQTKNRVIDAKIANPVIEEKQTTTKTSQPTTTQDRMMWNMQRIGANTAQSRGYWGAGIKIAVLDTGISTHNDLVVYGGASFIPGTSSYNDRNGHGTHCAGVIGSRINNRGLMGVAPLSRLYAVKVLNDSGSGNFSWILSGMAWALRNKMNVVTMSLGAPVPPNWALRRMVNILNQAGITVVAAAGNSNSARSNFPYVNTPANCQGVIAVGATNYYNRIAPFSSRGGNWNQVTLCAPGTNIISTFPTNSYRSLSGTSMACPHVAGAIALIKRRFPTASPAWIKQRLMSTARDLGAPGNDPTYGAGMLACDRIV